MDREPVFGEIADLDTDFERLRRDEIAEAVGLLDEAAVKVNSFNVSRLLGWIKREAAPFSDRLMNRERYTELSLQLHVKHETDSVER